MKKQRLPLDIQFLIESILDESSNRIGLNNEAVLNEDPDDVYLLNKDGAEQRLARYVDDDAVAFIIFPTFSIILPNGVHSDIKRLLSTIYIKFLTGNDANKSDVEEAIDQQKLDNIQISDIDAMLKDLGGNGVAKKAFEAGMFATSTGYRHKIEHSLSGRFWPEKSIISFWNKRSDVIKNWREVQKMFKSHYGYGSVDQYEVDFLERSGDEKQPLTPASSISKSVEPRSEKKDNSNQLNFLGKLLSKPENLDTLSDEQMEKLAGKLHVMTPGEKNKVMKAAGMNYNKAAEIANKLGMTVAEFNSIMQVAEEKIPSLKEIAEKINKK